MNKLVDMALPAAFAADPRRMLREHVLKACFAALERKPYADGCASWRERASRVRKIVRDSLGGLAFGPLHTRLVSRRDLGDVVLENLLFDSLPGHEVNGSLFLPQGPGPWPAVVVAVGHDAKHFRDAQLPARFFARRGLAALTFDPPGMAGEKRRGNCHFADGVRCALTGHSSNRYFVADTLRAVDYLATRSDIDLAAGLAVTGNSGGGASSVFAGLLDDRFQVVIPACCMVPLAYHPLADGYGLCPEKYFDNRVGMGIDELDLLMALCPKPTLVMTGANDTALRIEWARELGDAAAASFAAAGHGDRFGFFADDCPHQYSAPMAAAAVRWMARWFPAFRPAEAPEGYPEMLPAEALRCGPRTDTNMVSANLAMADALAATRKPGEPKASLAAVVRGIDQLAAPHARVQEPMRMASYWAASFMLETEPGIEVPGELLWPAAGDAQALLLNFDDQGRWRSLRPGGLLQAAGLPFGDSPLRLAAMGVDLRGWGDTAPANTPFDLCSWAAPDRWMGYVSTTLGDPVLAMRIRDAMAAWHFVVGRPETANAKIFGSSAKRGKIIWPF